MKLNRIVAAVAVVVACSAGHAQTRSLAEIDGPAEVPPQSYEGRQYVDSEGCVFVRAGVDGTVTWVPRVTSDHEVICGQPPTFGGLPAAAETAETAVSAEEGGAPLLVPDDALPRAGKAALPPQAGASRPAAGPRVAPRRVYSEQVVSRRGVAVPEGYKPVWTDGRLNPRRAHQTFAGQERMERIWTSNVPRRLIVRRAGKIVMRDREDEGTARASHPQNSPAVGQGRSWVRVPDPAAGTVRANVSTSSPAVKSGPASHRYVQAGLFDSRAEATRLAREVAREGFPARLGRLERGGESFNLVLVGPFRRQDGLDQAVAGLRRAGFGKLVLRE